MIRVWKMAEHVVSAPDIAASGAFARYKLAMRIRGGGFL
jgi:hypothetical protein